MQKLKYYREKNSYSFQKMANLLGISKTYYWQIENKKRRLSYEMAIRISDIFSIRPDEMFFDDVVKNISNLRSKKNNFH